MQNSTACIWQQPCSLMYACPPTMSAMAINFRCRYQPLTHFLLQVTSTDKHCDYISLSHSTKCSPASDVRAGQAFLLVWANAAFLRWLDYQSHTNLVLSASGERKRKDYVRIARKRAWQNVKQVVHLRCFDWAPNVLWDRMSQRSRLPFFMVKVSTVMDNW